MDTNRICHNCQKKNPGDAQFCMHCGTNLGDPAVFFLAEKELKSTPSRSELSTLLDLTETLQAGLGGVVVITGDARIGKSQLVRAWQKKMADLHGSKPLRWVIVKPGIVSDESQFAYHGLIRQSFFESGFPLTTEEIDPQGDDPISLAAEIQAITGSMPLILVLEDIQTLGRSSIPTIESLVSLTYLAPFMLVLVSRYERASPGWQVIKKVSDHSDPHVVHINLDAMNRQQTSRLIMEYLDCISEPANLVDEVYRLANGNPGYTLDIIKAIVDQGIIKRSGKRWQIPRNLSGIPIPGEIRDDFYLVLNQLPGTSRVTLEVASVIGLTFQRTLIDHIIKKIDPEIPVNQLIALLETNNLFKREQVKPEIIYAFRQPILQAIIYEDIEPARRKQLHFITAEAIQALYPEEINKQATILAYHHIQAGNKGSAGKFFSLAANQALDEERDQEAEELFGRAIAFTKNRRDKAELYLGLGKTLAHQRQHTDAIQTWEKAAKTFIALHDHPMIAKTYALMARSAWGNSDLQKCLEIALAGWELVKEEPATSEHAALVHEIGRAYFFINDMENAQAYCEQALRMTRELKAFDMQAEVLATMGVLPTLPPKKAVAALQASIRLAEQYGLPSTAFRAYINLSSILEDIGEVRLARDQRIKALQFSRSVFFASDEQDVYASIIYADIWLGEFDTARDHLKKLRLFERQGYEKEHGNLSIMMLEGQLERHLGNISRAIELFSELITEAGKNNVVELVQQGNYYLAEIFLESIFMAEGVISADKVGMAEGFIKRADEVGDVLQAGFFAVSQSIVIKALQGKPAEAEKLLQTLKAGNFAPKAYAKAITLLTEARMAGAGQDFKNSLVKYTKCLPFFEKIEARWWVSHIKLEMAILQILINEPESNETAQNLLRECLVEFKDMRCEYYPDVIIDKLRIVRQQAQQQAVTSRLNKRELDQAGRVQTSFIPSNLPDLPGWQISATIEPARETSGDFFDFIKLSTGRFGIVIADVGDKGAGAALYMAMCRTLFRSYAPNYPDDPARVLHDVNERIMSDTQNGIFLTAVYAILDPIHSTLIYANAGHNPPCYLNFDHKTGMRSLLPTGPLIGIFSDSAWINQKLKLTPGETLVLYTDGITEAQNLAEDLYGDSRLCSLLQTIPPTDAPVIMGRILDDVHSFVDSAPIQDDITMIILKKAESNQ